MKFAFLAKFKISTAFDDPPAGPTPSSAPDSPEIREFSQTLVALHDRLKAGQPTLDAPREMHDSIMRAVRLSHRATVASDAGFGRLRIATAAVALTAVALCLWWQTNPPTDLASGEINSLSAATTALQIGSEMPPAISSSTIAPLSSELERVNQDIGNLTEFLLASLP